MRSIGTAVAAAALALGGCRIEVGSAEFRPEERVPMGVDRAVTDSSIRSLDVSTDAGSVTLWPNEGASEVRTHATVWAKTEEDLKRVSIKLDVVGGVARLGYTVSGDRDGISVSFEVTAPSSLPARLRSGAGSISVRGWQAGIDARTEAGAVWTEGIRGDQTLASGAGSIRASDAEGQVRAETSAGSVQVAGRLRGDSRAVSHAGSITVVLPTDARLRLSGGTSAGSVVCAFPVLLGGGPAGGTLEGTLGDGKDGSLRVESAAGSVRIEGSSGSLVLGSK
jgi:hypothetical protein